MAAETLSIEVKKREELSEHEYSEILALLSRAYREDYKPLSETFCGATHILGRYQGLLVTHALWVTRWLQCATSPLMQTAYVEAVATEDDYRNRGLATAIMRRLAEEIRDFDLGGLSASRHGFYARIGWQLWRGPLFIRTTEGLVPTPNEHDVMVLFLPNKPVLDLDAPLSAEWREGELW
jgi:aminoglycoside 2'-N-acetyltransferase I